MTIKKKLIYSKNINVLTRIFYMSYIKVFCYTLLFILILPNIISTKESKKIVFYVAGNPGGLNFEVSNELKQHLLNLNYDLDLEISGNCINAQKQFLDEKRPALLLVFNGMAAHEDCSKIVPTKNSLASNIFFQRLLFCGRPEKDNLQIIKSNQKAMVGLGSEYPKTMVTSLGSNIKTVTYQNSGAIVAGFLAGDIDFFISNFSRGTQLMQQNKATCFAVTGDKSHFGVPPALQVLPEWKYNDTLYLMAIIQNNFSEEEKKLLISHIKQINNSQNWQNYAKKNNFVTDTAIGHEVFVNSLKNWKISN